MPTITAEALGLAALIAVVAIVGRALAALDRRHQRRGGTPLGFVSDRTLEQARRQLGDRPPLELTGGRVTPLDEQPPGRRYGDVYVGLDQDGGDR